MTIDQKLTSYGDPEFSVFLRRTFLASAGYDRTDLERPIVGIANTVSDYVTCHRELPAVVDALRRGVLEAGGLPMVFPTMALGEMFVEPTTMLYRNLLALETEEQIRSQPMDAVILVGGCDKTIPAQLMAAVSADVPAILEVAGPMHTGTWRGERVGACTDCRRAWSAYRAGELDDQELSELETALCPGAGTCMVMGTASTMACLAEAMGFLLPGGATAAAGSGDRQRHAVATGRHAVDIAMRVVRPSAHLDDDAFHDALVVLAALGGSTNAVIHLLAVARRAAVPLQLVDFDKVSRKVPVLVDCKPTGTRYLDDFHAAGGMPALLSVLAPLLRTRSVQSVPPNRPSPHGTDVIRPLEQPVAPAGSLVVVQGSLAPDGAVLKASAASAALLSHAGPALVFDSAADAQHRLDDPDLDVTPDHVLVLRNEGPQASGMPEAGSLPIPRKLARAGTRDMVRVSDARMSGTAYGTVVLHCAPEAAVGGPLALVRDGDIIELDVGERRLDLRVHESELARRLADWRPPPPPARGWRWLHSAHVQPANLGADLDFLGPEP